jgi:hypothetical protein
MMDKMDEIAKGTLNWCNERRAEKGLEPLDDLPKGKKYDGNTCPCGNACGYYVGYEKYFVRTCEDSGTMEDPDEYPDRFSVVDSVPNCVKEFTRLFDNGGYPEYEQK